MKFSKLIAAAVVSISLMGVAHADVANFRVAGQGNVLVAKGDAMIVTDSGKSNHFIRTGQFRNGAWVNFVYKSENVSGEYLIVGLNGDAGFTTFVEGNADHINWSYKMDNRYVSFK